MSNIVKQGQCLIDKVIHLTGSYESALDIAIENGVSVTAIIGDDDLAIGSTITVKKIINKAVVAFFNKNNEPATSIDRKTIAAIGIGDMEIGSTFIIG